MITNRKTLKIYLDEERKLYKINFVSHFLGLFFASEKGLIWRFQKRLRIWEYHYNCRHKIRSAFCQFRTNRLGFKLGFHICPNCFEKGLIIRHIGSILVNSYTRVGENCILNINTSFVSTGGNNDSPKIGNNCLVGIGSTLIGGISIGDNTIIGAGAIVTKSFECGYVTLVGVPAKISNNQQNIIKANES